MVIGLRREALVEALRKPLAVAPSKSVNVKYFGEAKVSLLNIGVRSINGWII
jgi:hypothetical protein